MDPVWPLLIYIPYVWQATAVVFCYRLWGMVWASSTQCSQCEGKSGRKGAGEIGRFAFICVAAWEVREAGLLQAFT